MPRVQRASGASASCGQRWLRTLLLCLLHRAVGAGPSKAEKPAQPSDEDNPKQFFGWSQYRYTRFDDKAPPQPHDKETSILTGGDVKCEVCKVILADVLERLESKSGASGKAEDAILEALEADSIDQEAVLAAKTQMEAYVLKHYGGCNRLYKESYLAKGFSVETCTRMAEGQHHMTLPEDQAQWACSKRQKNPPSERELNTYSVKKEAAHYACERTVGDHRDALAAFLSAKLRRGDTNITELVGKACRTKAKCLARKPGESPESRVTAQAKKAQQASDRVDELLKKLEKENKKLEKQEKKAKKEEEAAQREDEVEL